MTRAADWLGRQSRHARERADLMRFWKWLSVMVLALLAMTTTYVVAQQRRRSPETHTLKTFYPCPRGVCSELEARRFVDTENPSYVIDPFGTDPTTFAPDPTQQSQLQHVTIDTTTNPDIPVDQQGGRLTIGRPGEAGFPQPFDPGLLCPECVNGSDVNPDVVQWRVDGTCSGERQAIGNIEADGSVDCVAITERTITGP